MTLQESPNNEYMAITKQKVLRIIENKTANWFNIINSFGLDSQHYKNWCDQLVEEINDTTTECLASVAKRRDELLLKIETLLQKCEQLCKQLGIKLPQFESCSEGLYQDEANLIKHITTWQEEIDKRMAEITSIKDERDSLCSQLSVIPFKIKENPLPNENELLTYRQNISEMKLEKTTRIEESQKLYDQIMLIIEKINYKPRTLFEQDIVSRNSNSDFNITEEHMLLIKNFHDEITNKYELMEVDINASLAQLNDIWKTLKEDATYCSNFVKNHSDVDLYNLEEIKIELHRCQDLRRNDLKQLIDALRIELIGLWNVAGYTPEQRKYFKSIINDELYTEDLLAMHEFAVEHMREYLNKVDEILELLKTRGELYEEMQVFAQNLKGPDRYKNRGGQLLREEKARKAISKKIPLIEKKLLKLSARYETNYGTPFLYNGQPISKLISNSSENNRQENHDRESVSKIYKSPNPSRNGFNTYTSSNKSPLKLGRTTPVKWVVKRRPTSKVKRSNSGEKKRNQTNRIPNTTTLNENEVENYSKFETSLSVKKDSRSTMTMDSPETTNPHKSNVLRTPLSKNSYLDVPKKLKF